MQTEQICRFTNNHKKMKNIIKKIGIGTMIFVVMSALIIPTTSFAKEKENRDRNDDKIENREKAKNEDKKFENGKEKYCWRAFGHLIANGWRKKNNEIEFNVDCKMPFGIGKKFKDNSTTTTDIIAPTISNINTVTGATNANVMWNTNEITGGTVFWSTNSGFSTTTAMGSKTSHLGKNTNHNVVIKNLSASTTYYAFIHSRDKTQNLTVSPQFSFTTKTSAIVGDVTAPTIWAITGAIGTSTISVAWKTDELSTSKVYYSLISPVVKTASSTMNTESSSLSTNHLVNISDLATSTKYYLYVESKDVSGNAQSSTEFSFTTNN
jgi:hypothetical protein